MNTKRVSVSIVIPNYNTWDLVKRNIDACLKHDSDWIHEIIVVDDFSPTENYIEFDSRVRIIRNPSNYRYTKTVNIGLAASKGDIIILLDSDAYPTHPFIEKVVSIYSSEPKLGCIGFKTINDRGEDTGNFMTEPSILSLISGQKLHGLLRKFNPFASKNILPFSCAVCFRKLCLSEVGLLDETFTVLDADHDLSMRIHRSNWKLCYESTIAIFHVGGGSIPKDGKRVMMFYQSRMHLLKKYNKLVLAPLSLRIVIARLVLEKFIMNTFNSKQPHKAEARQNLINLIRNEL